MRRTTCVGPSSGESIGSTGTVTDVTQKFSKTPFSLREGAPQDTTPYTYPLFFIGTYIRGMPTSYRKPGIHNYREVHFRGKFSQIFKNYQNDSTWKESHQPVQLLRIWSSPPALVPLNQTILISIANRMRHILPRASRFHFTQSKARAASR
jgi:hypothetical protein